MSVFFHVNEWTKEHGHFQYLVVCLAEGLRELGFSTYGSANYWQFEPGKYLVGKSRLPDDADIIVYNDEGPLPAKPKRDGEKTVLMDMSDAQGARLAGIWPDFDYVFRCQYTAGWPYPDNAIPWAFGLDNRIIQATQDFVPVREKLYQMESNYRVGHPLRLWIEEQGFFEWVRDHVMPVRRKCEGWADRPESPYDGLMWDQTGRHHPNYYKRLKGSLTCACFGGRLQDHTLVQFDSWRLWESWAAACVPIHFNLERYGARLPVMPVNGQHYIGVDLDDWRGCMRRVSRSVLEDAAEAGREWALKHYSPRAIAERFLSEIKF